VLLRQRHPVWLKLNMQTFCMFQQEARPWHQSGFFQRTNTDCGSQ